MESVNYTLCSGFYGDHKARNFSSMWARNLVDHCSVKPKAIVIQSVGGSGIPNVHKTFLEHGWPVAQTTILTGNLGHVGQLMGGEKDHLMCGWSAALLWGAMTAYANETDCLFFEQDVLAFGDWFGQMMEDLGDGQMIWGKKHTSPPYMHGSNSIVYIRHNFISQFIADYINCGPESHEDHVPETKFKMIENKYPQAVRRLSYPFDRERPLDYNLPVWYGQKFTDEEICELQKRGMA